MAEIKKESACLLDIQYIKPSSLTNWVDYLYIIWKDLDTGEKYLDIKESPYIPIYIEKETSRDSHFNPRTERYYNLPWQWLSNVEKKVVPYKDVLAAIAEAAGRQAFETYKNLRRAKNYTKVAEFQLWPFVFGSDIDIRTIYRNEWRDKYDNDRPKELTKGFLDIEVDIMETGVTDPDFCPIDLVTLIDLSRKNSYTFALVGVVGAEKDLTRLSPERRSLEMENQRLYNERIKQQDELTSKSGTKKLIEELHEKFDESYPGMEYNIYWYKDEKKMLIQLFQLINELKLDFIGIWNMRFDIPFIIQRFRALGLDPAEYMCHPDFPVKECYFMEDRRNFTIKNQTDFFHCSSYTTFICQMRNYAAIRKGRSELRRNSLSYIAKKEIGDDKLDYSEFATSIRKISCTNYRMYIIYNIKDVLLQCGIESVTNDMDAFYSACYESVIPYDCVYKQTRRLRGVQYRSYLEQNIIVGNNLNAFFNLEKSEDALDDSNNDDDNETETKKAKFEGALVGNPELNSKFGQKVFGHRTSYAFAFSIDMDMTSFYPCTIGAMNIDPRALIFKCILDPIQYTVRGGKHKFNGITGTQLVNSNPDTFSDDVAKECLDNLQTRNYMSTAHKWLNFPDVTEIYLECMKGD